MNRTTQNLIRENAAAARALGTESADRIGDRSVPFVLGKITGSTAIAGQVNRWLYTWSQASIGSTSSYLFSQVASEPWYYGDALNVVEGINDATNVGPGVLVANIPAGFTVKPVIGYVLLYPGRRADGSPVWLFCVPNAIDGNC